MYRYIEMLRNPNIGTHYFFAVNGPVNAKLYHAQRLLKVFLDVNVTYVEKIFDLFARKHCMKINVH